MRSWTALNRKVVWASRRLASENCRSAWSSHETADHAGDEPQPFQCGPSAMSSAPRPRGPCRVRGGRAGGRGAGLRGEPPTTVIPGSLVSCRGGCRCRVRAGGIRSERLAGLWNVVRAAFSSAVLPAQVLRLRSGRDRRLCALRGWHVGCLASPAGGPGWREKPDL
jgi:hypothetical protein